MNGSLLFPNSNSLDNKDRSLYPSFIKGQKHLYLLTEEQNSKYIQIFNKTSFIQPSKAASASNKIIFSSKGNATAKGSQPSTLSKPPQANDNYTLFNAYVSKAKPQSKKKAVKQSLWYGDGNRTGYSNATPLEKKNIANSLTLNNGNTSDQSRKSSKKKSQTVKGISFPIENGLPRIDNSKRMNGSRLFLRKKPQAIENDSSHRESYSTRGIDAKESSLLNYQFDLIYSNRIRESNDAGYLEACLRDSKGLSNGMNMTKSNIRFDNTALLNETKTDDDTSRRESRDRHKATQEIKNKASAVNSNKHEDENQHKEGLANAEKATTFNAYVKKMKFITMFSNQREEIMQLAHKSKHSALKYALTSIKIDRAIHNRKETRKSIFLSKFNLTASILLSDADSDNQIPDASLMEDELMLSINKDSTVSQMIVANCDHLNTNYFDIYSCMLGYCPMTKTTTKPPVIVTMFNNLVKGRTLLDNFSVGHLIHNKHKMKLQQKDNLRRVENKISLEDRCYINTFITKNISSSSNTNKPNLILPKPTRRETKKKTTRAVHRTNHNAPLSAERISKRETTYDITSEAIESKQKPIIIDLTPEYPQSKPLKTQEDLDNNIAKINLLKNQDLFTLPFKKKRMVKLQKRRLMELLYEKGKSYRMCAKAQKDYFAMQKAGLTGDSHNLSLRKIKSIAFMNKLYRKKSKPEILFDLIYSNDSEHFVKQMDALNRNEHVNTQDQFGNTLLLIASKTSNLTIAKYLLELGANPNLLNKNKDSPLHFALSSKNFQMANLLISFNANENAVNNEGLTPWEYMYKKCS